MDVHDYEDLGRRINRHASVVRNHFETLNFENFRVKDLKEIIEFMQGKGYPQLKKTGRKQELQQAICQSLRMRSSSPSSSSSYRHPPFPSSRYAPPIPPPPSYAATSSYGGGGIPAYPGMSSGLPDSYGSSSGWPPTHKHDPYPSHRNPFPPSSARNIRSVSPPHPVSYSHRKPREDLEQRLLTMHNIGRSPFFALEGVLGHASLSKYYPASFKFSIAPNQYIHLRTPKRPDGHFLVHAHLITSEGKHLTWDTHFRITINQYELRPPNPKGKSKLKKKGHEFVKPIDISEYVQYSNVFKVEFLPLEDMLQFQGHVILEVVRIKTTQEVRDEVSKRVHPSSSSISSSSFSSPPPEVKECGVCRSRDEDKLLRCSRCRVKWYCGPDHQRIDWQKHEPVCKPPSVKPEPRHEEAAVAVKKEKLHDTVAEGVVEGDALLSLACPLSIRRIDTPAKGTKCDHTRCFDLDTFILYCEQSWIWQCPICDHAISPDQLMLDPKLARILREAPEDCEQVRLKPNGEFEPVVAISMQEKEDRMIKRRKRMERRKSERKDKAELAEDGSSNRNHISQSSRHSSNGSDRTPLASRHNSHNSANSGDARTGQVPWDPDRMGSSLGGDGGSLLAYGSGGRRRDDLGDISGASEDEESRDTPRRGMSRESAREPLDPEEVLEGGSTLEDAIVLD
eukprot:gb/GEZN01002852.1/.p1 GENE.gb/GEZN01002852.1/~~gb/GEZN01002852.1/.p1  ORF type:complete len:679 (-),score=79.14 gb/GEZN01002852.1/:134-2170(-)